MMRNILIAMCFLFSGCGLHANPDVWQAHDRLFECEYDHVEPIMSTTSQHLAMMTVRYPLNGQDCETWTFHHPAPRRMVHDCVDYLSSSVDCSQFNTRMLQCNLCFISWLDETQ